MRNFITALFAVALTTVGMTASAQQAIFGTGATSASSSGVTYQGQAGSGSLLAGLSFSQNNITSNQTTAGVGIGSTNVGTSAAVTGTGNTGTTTNTSASGSLGFAAGTGNSSFSGVNGSDATAFGGFGFRLP